jgi:hypothetical protein
VSNTSFLTLPEMTGQHVNKSRPVIYLCTLSLVDVRSSKHVILLVKDRTWLCEFSFLMYILVEATHAY